MMMTLRRLAPLLLHASLPSALPVDLARAGAAIEQRRGERCASKLARRLRRKNELGRAGAF